MSLSQWWILSIAFAIYFGVSAYSHRVPLRAFIGSLPNKMVILLPSIRRRLRRLPKRLLVLAIRTKRNTKRNVRRSRIWITRKKRQLARFDRAHPYVFRRLEILIMIVTTAALIYYTTIAKTTLVVGVWWIFRGRKRFPSVEVWGEKWSTNWILAPFLLGAGIIIGTQWLWAIVSWKFLEATGFRLSRVLLATATVLLIGTLLFRRKGSATPTPTTASGASAAPTPVAPAAANNNPSGDHVFNFTGGFLIGLAALLFVGASIFFYWQSGAMGKNNAENDDSDAMRNRAAERLNAEAANYEFTEAQVPAELAAPEIAYCESRNRQFEDDGKTPLKTQAGPPWDAFGKYQFREGHRVLAITHVPSLDLNTEAGQDGYFRVVWNKEGSTPWLASKGCWYPHLQAIAEQRGTRPTGIPGQRHLKYLETTEDWSQPETVLSSPGFQIRWESIGGKPYCVRVNRNDKFTFCSTKENPLVEIPPEKVKEIRYAESLEFKSEESAKIRLFLSPS